MQNNNNLNPKNEFSNSISNGLHHNAESKLAFFPIMLFASVMGLGGLALAFKKASVAFLLNSHFQSANIADISSLVFAILAIIIFTLLLGFYVAKIFFYFKEFKAELSHQVKINFFSAIPICALIIATFLGTLKIDEFYLKILFYPASFLQVILSLYVIAFWFNNAMKKEILSPAWFIPIVGNLIVPLAAHYAKIPFEISLFFFAVGCFFWLILTALITSRLIFEKSLEAKFLPTLFIFIAPPSIFVVDFSALFEMQNVLSLMIYFIALFFMLLMLSLAKNFKNLPFALSWWAFTFPLCAFSIASFEIFIFFGRNFYLFFGIFGLILAFCAVFFIFYKTIIAIKKGKIFVKE